MKKILLILTFLISTIGISQTTEVKNNKLILKQTPNLSVVDSIVSKDSNQMLMSTSFVDFKTQLGLGSFLENIVEDLTPQLGGGLDLNNFDITGTGNINNTGNITTSGTLQSLDAIITNDVQFSNYPNTRVDADAVNFLHTDISGNLLSSSIIAINPLTTKGDVFTYDTSNQRLPVGTNGQLLSANSAQTTGLEWVDASLFVTGLESITENSKTGRRLIGRDPLNYGDTGINGTDFSFSGSPSSTIGATGDQSVSFGQINIVSGFSAFSNGYNNIASNTYSHAFGQDGNSGGYSSFTFGVNNIATGDYSWAIGAENQALGNHDIVFGAYNIANSFTKSFSTGIGNINTGAGSLVSGIALTNDDNWGATVIGQSNTDFTGSGSSRLATDRIFVLGNGTHTTPVGSIWLPSVKSDAMIVLRSGEITAPSLTKTIINAEATGKALVTKEWVNTETGFLVSPLTTKGDVFTYDTSNQRLPVGTNGQLLSANSAQTTGLEWVGNVAYLNQNIPFSIGQIIQGGLQLTGATDKSLEITSLSNNKGFFTALQDTAQFGVNRNPVNGVFADVTKAASSIKMNSGVGDSNIEFTTTTVNNSNPITRLTINKDGDAIFTNDVTAEQIIAKSQLTLQSSDLTRGSIRPEVDATTGGKLNFYTRNTAGVDTQALTIDSSQNSSLLGTSTIKNALIINGSDFDLATVKSSSGLIISEVDTQDGTFNFADSAITVDGSDKTTLSKLNLSGISTYADDSAAGVGGLVSGDVYKTATGELRIKL